MGTFEEGHDCWICTSKISIFNTEGDFDPPEFCPNCLGSVEWDNEYDDELGVIYWIHSMLPYRKGEKKMANFNKSVSKGRMTKGFNPTVNHEGTTVHGLDNLEALFSKVLGSFFGESTHYEKREADGEFEALYRRILEVSDEDKEYVLKIAEIGRMCNMISYPINILSCVFNDPKFTGGTFVDERGRNKVSTYADNIILRTKDITSIMATQFYKFDKRSGSCIPSVKGKSLPMQLRKTLKEKIESYDKFKLSKGLSKNNDVTLADCIKLLRPKPRNQEYADFYKSILEGKVTVGHNKTTLNTELVKKGQKKTKDTSGLKKAIHEDNLMNIVKSLATLLDNGAFKDEEVLNKVCSRLNNLEEIKRSKLLPFRFSTAHATIFSRRTTEARKLREALEQAIELSISNVPKIEGTTAILIDVSASMRDRISSKSCVTAKEIACMLGAIAYKNSDADLYAFSNDIKRVDVSKNSTVIDIAKAIEKAVHCEGTELNNALTFINDEAKKHNIKYDSLIFLTDADCYGYDKNTNSLYLKSWSYFSRHETPDNQVNDMIKSGVVGRLWVNNLLGNNFSIVNTAGDKKNLIAGFSEKCFDMFSTYNKLGSDKDIRKVIDDYYMSLKNSK